MIFSISNNNISLGTDFELSCGGVRLTLNKGFMRQGGKLPLSTGLVSPDFSQANIDIGSRKIIYTVPSLDTPVCEYQIKTVSALMDMGELGDSYIYVISIDTPFTQSRFIKESNINGKIKFLSDYSDHYFMSNNGLRIIELNLFARAVISCDEKNVVCDITIPKDITQLPYDK